MLDRDSKLRSGTQSNDIALNLSTVFTALHCRLRDTKIKESARTCKAQAVAICCVTRRRLCWDSACPSLGLPCTVIQRNSSAKRFCASTHLVLKHIRCQHGCGSLQTVYTIAISGIKTGRRVKKNGTESTSDPSRAFPWYSTASTNSQSFPPSSCRNEYVFYFGTDVRRAQLNER